MSGNASRSKRLNNAHKNAEGSVRTLQLPQYPSLAAMIESFGRTKGCVFDCEESLRSLLASLPWATFTRRLPYHPSSSSHLAESCLLIKQGSSVNDFWVEGTGNVVPKPGAAPPPLQDAVDGRVAEETRAAENSVALRTFVVLDAPPTKTLYVLHGSCAYAAYRFKIELHFILSKNKMDLLEYLQTNLRDMHPLILPDFFRCLVSAAKARKGIAGFNAVRDRFYKAIVAYSMLKVNEEWKSSEASRASSTRSSSAVRSRQSDASSSCSSTRMSTPVVSRAGSPAPPPNNVSQRETPRLVFSPNTPTERPPSTCSDPFESTASSGVLPDVVLGLSCSLSDALDDIMRSQRPQKHAEVIRLMNKHITPNLLLFDDEPAQGSKPGTMQQTQQRGDVGASLNASVKSLLVACNASQERKVSAVGLSPDAPSASTFISAISVTGPQSSPRGRPIDEPPQHQLCASFHSNSIDGFNLNLG